MLFIRISILLPLIFSFLLPPQISNSQRFIKDVFVDWDNDEIYMVLHHKLRIIKGNVAEDTKVKLLAPDWTKGGQIYQERLYNIDRVAVDETGKPWILMSGRAATRCEVNHSFWGMALSGNWAVSSNITDIAYADGVYTAKVKGEYKVNRTSTLNCDSGYRLPCFKKTAKTEGKSIFPDRSAWKPSSNLLASLSSSKQEIRNDLDTIVWAIKNPAKNEYILVGWKGAWRYNGDTEKGTKLKILTPTEEANDSLSKKLHDDALAGLKDNPIDSAIRKLYRAKKLSPIYHSIINYGLFQCHYFRKDYKTVWKIYMDGDVADSILTVSDLAMLCRTGFEVDYDYEAKEIEKRILKASNIPSHAWYAMASGRMINEDHEKAIEYFSKVEDDSKPHALMAMVVCHQKLDNKTEDELCEIVNEAFSVAEKQGNESFAVAYLESEATGAFTSLVKDCRKK